MTVLHNSSTVNEEQWYCQSLCLTIQLRLGLFADIVHKFRKEGAQLIIQGLTLKSLIVPAHYRWWTSCPRHHYWPSSRNNLQQLWFESLPAHVSHDRNHEPFSSLLFGDLLVWRPAGTGQRSAPHPHSQEENLPRVLRKIDLLMYSSRYPSSVEVTTHSTHHPGGLAALEYSSISTFSYPE